MVFSHIWALVEISSSFEVFSGMLLDLKEISELLVG